MKSLKEKFEEEIFNSRSKSRKTVKNKTDLIMNSKVFESFIPQPNTNAYRNRPSPTSNYSLELKNCKQKIREIIEEKDSLNGAIKSNQKECQFLTQIISQFVDFNELTKVKQKSIFDEEAQSWNLPKFVVQEKKIIFPKMQKLQCNDLVYNKLKQRKIIFKANESKAVDAFSTEDSSLKREKSSECEDRPVTSISRHRQTSMGTRVQEEVRKSPILRQLKFNL